MPLVDDDQQSLDLNAFHDAGTWSSDDDDSDNESCAPGNAIV